MLFWLLTICSISVRRLIVVVCGLVGAHRISSVVSVLFVVRNMTEVRKFISYPFIDASIGQCSR